MIGARGPALLEKRILAFEVILRLSQRCLRRSKIGLRRSQLVHLVLRFEARHYLSGLNPIAQPSVVFEQAPRDFPHLQDRAIRPPSRGERITKMFAAGANVCFWHKADMTIAFGNVCFWGLS
jgi:hypothetical protein